MKACRGRTRTAPIILNHGTRRQVANFTPVEEATGTHWLWGRLGFRVDADAIEKGKICVSWDSNPRPPSLSQSHCTDHAISPQLKVKHWKNNKGVRRRKIKVWYKLCLGPPCSDNWIVSSSHDAHLLWGWRQTVPLKNHYQTRCHSSEDSKSSCAIIRTSNAT
jgi:hypothetical protein